MASYRITSSTTNFTWEIGTRKRRDAAALLFHRTVYEMIKGLALLDRPIGHEVYKMGIAVAAGIERGNGIGGSVCLRDEYVTIERIA